MDVWLIFIYPTFSCSLSHQGDKRQFATCQQQCPRNNIIHYYYKLIITNKLRILKLDICRASKKSNLTNKLFLNIQIQIHEIVKDDIHNWVASFLELVLAGAIMCPIWFGFIIFKPYYYNSKWMYVWQDLPLGQQPKRRLRQAG